MKNFNSKTTKFVISSDGKKAHYIVEDGKVSVSLAAKHLCSTSTVEYDETKPLTAEYKDGTKGIYFQGILSGFDVAEASQI